MIKDMIGMSISLSFENHSHPHIFDVPSADYKAYEDVKDSSIFRMFYLDLNFQLYFLQNKLQCNDEPSNIHVWPHSSQYYQGQ